MQESLYRKIIEESSYVYAYIKRVNDEAQRPVDFEFIEVNAAFTCIFSLSKEDIIGKKITDMHSFVRFKIRNSL